SAGMSPQAPRHVFELRMIRLRGEIVDGSQERARRAVPRIAPQPAILLIRLMIARAEQRAVPLFGERLPMQIVRRRVAPFAGSGSAAVLMDDDAAKGLDSVRQPKPIRDGHLEAVRLGRCGILDGEMFTGGEGGCRQRGEPNGTNSG